MLFDIDGESPPKKRPGGWYDPGLVTRKGEDILSDLDDHAIKVFRDTGMLFSVRRDHGVELRGHDSCINKGIADGIYKVEVPDAPKLKLFALSLLWRAAATDRPEFSRVRLKAEDVDLLREILVGHRAVRHWEFPVIFGVFNNTYQFTDLTPFKVTIRGSRFVRWCMNGVIVYVSTRRRPSGEKGWGLLSVGSEQRGIRGLVLNYSESAQMKYCDDSILEHYERYGSPYRDDFEIAYPEYEFDLDGRRVRREV